MPRWLRDCSVSRSSTTTGRYLSPPMGQKRCVFTVWKMRRLGCEKEGCALSGALVRSSVSNSHPSPVVLTILKQFPIGILVYFSPSDTQILPLKTMSTPLLAGLVTSKSMTSI